MQVVSTGRRGRGGEGTLVLCVHHPEPSVREEAVRQLGRALRHRNKVSYIFSTVWSEISLGCKFGNVATVSKSYF